VYSPDINARVEVTPGGACFTGDIPEVLTERASCASTLGHQIVFARLHVSLKAVSSYNLMRMWTTDETRIDEGVETFHC
jgi:hypothetical protein